MEENHDTVASLIFRIRINYLAFNHGAHLREKV